MREDKERYKGKLPITTLSIGDKGEDVVCIQRFLNWYAPYDLKIDGIFGPATEAAVKNFQRTTGYQDNGIFDSLARYVAKYIQKEVGSNYAADTDTN